MTDHFLRVTSLGIGWVHPSWRDLVIEQLRADPAARARFLAACGLDGLMLALSHAGGEAGERSLPLLLGDRDWDILGDRVHHQLRELDERGVARVLHGLAGAVGAGAGSAEQRELDSLATASLTSLRQIWDRGQRPIPLILLEAWFGLNRAVWSSRPARSRDPLEPDPPELGPTWIEWHPGSMLREAHPDRSALARIDEWLALAGLLRRHHPPALERFDFYGHDRDLLTQLIPTLATSGTTPELRELAATVLARLESVLPELGDGTRSAIEIGRFSERIEAERWFVPDDLRAPPSHELVSSDTFRRDDVDRVLGDL